MTFRAPNQSINNAGFASSDLQPQAAGPVMSVVRRTTGSSIILGHNEPPHEEDRGL
jgi:hypothetical protein